MVHQRVGFDKQQAPAGPKRHTAVDSFGKRAVVVTAASVPECQASKQGASRFLTKHTYPF